MRPAIQAAVIGRRSRAINSIMQAADSLGSFSYLQNDGQFPWLYKASRTDVAIRVDGWSGKTIGVIANLNDHDDTFGGTLFSHMDRDTADLYATMIGTNDFVSGTSVATYKANLTSLFATVRSYGVKKIMYSILIVPNPDGSATNYATIVSRRSSLLSTIRDPAVWGALGADYYNPAGETPLITSDFGDALHPNASGNAKIFTQDSAAKDGALDLSRAGATQMYNSAWPLGQTGLPTSTVQTVSFTVKGLRPDGITLSGGNALSISGGSSQLRVNGGSYGASFSGWLYNGDLVDFQVTTSASNLTDTLVTLQIGSETRVLNFKTQALVTPVTYTHGALVQTSVVGTSYSQSVTFPGAGTYLLFLENGQAAIGSSMSVGGTAATTITYSVGVGANCVTAFVVTLASGGAKTITATMSTFTSQAVLSWGQVNDADPLAAPVPVAFSPATAGNAPSNESDPHLTETFTVPASGLAIGAMGTFSGGNVATNGSVNSGTTLIDTNHYFDAGQSQTDGMVVGKRGVGTGVTLSFSYGFGNLARVAVIFKANGT